mgnify:CR=1 FL=1
MFLLAAALAGCSVMPVLPVGDAKLPSAVMPFSFEGRLTVRHSDESIAGKISWKHQLTQDQIRLLSPFGQQVAAIIRHNDLYQLTDGKVVIESENIQSLTTEQLGYTLPVNSMPSCVLGIPALPFTRQHQSLPIHINVHPWTLSYEAYTIQEGYLLPIKMTFSTQDLTVRLIVDRWNIIAP